MPAEDRGALTFDPCDPIMLASPPPHEFEQGAPAGVEYADVSQLISESRTAATPSADMQGLSTTNLYVVKQCSSVYIGGC
jgi:hypothetical protein